VAGLRLKTAGEHGGIEAAAKRYLKREASGKNQKPTRQTETSSPCAGCNVQARTPAGGNTVSLTVGMRIFGPGINTLESIHD